MNCRRPCEIPGSGDATRRCDSGGAAAGLRDHHALYRTLMFGPSPLSRSEREAIAVEVSRTNECHY
jgi:alkylhydroperoxidase family enzyme